ncbi:MAG TPA: PD-(D/E)XK nuclease family protein [Terriglobia bacterium]|nr:PD-(D/E)XK nuclease family protein [Terriglobia bacterium]
MPVYSHSQLATFEECPLRYKFKYVDRIKGAGTSVEAFLGSMVHRTLQKLYDDLNYEKLNSVEDVLEYYQEEWRQRWSQEIRLVRAGLSADNYRDYGARCIRDYYERNFPFNQSRTLETELHLVFSLDTEGRYRMQGFVDRVAIRADGVYEIHDYKTSNTLPDRARLEMDRQLPLYQIGLHSRWPEAERIDLIWHYLGFAATFVSSRTADQLRELASRTMERIDEVETCKNFPPVKSRLCDWCEYRAQCPLWKHVVTVESLPASAVTEDSGVRLATAYAETKFQLDGLRERLEKLKQEVLEFSRRSQADVIQGQGVRISISRREQLKLPPADDAARAEIEEFIRSIGRWDEACELSESRLGRIIEEKHWPAALLERLRTLLRKREVAVLRVSRSADSGVLED